QISSDRIRTAPSDRPSVRQVSHPEACAAHRAASFQPDASRARLSWKVRRGADTASYIPWRPFFFLFRIAGVVLFPAPQDPGPVWFREESLTYVRKQDKTNYRRERDILHTGKIRYAIVNKGKN